MDTSKQWHGGKGSKRRNPNEELYANNWEKIFGKRKPKTKPKKYKYNNEEQI